MASVAEIANTLADLHERLQLHHRDIKPSNLYLLDGRPAISDFGLADLPAADELTMTGRPLGPRFFLADEMIVDSKGADPAPADVFSLAKTLMGSCVWISVGRPRASSRPQMRHTLLEDTGLTHFLDNSTNWSNGALGMNLTNVLQ